MDQNVISKADNNPRNANGHDAVERNHHRLCEGPLCSKNAQRSLRRISRQIGILRQCVCFASRSNTTGTSVGTWRHPPKFSHVPPVRPDADKTTPARQVTTPDWPIKWRPGYPGRSSKLLLRGQIKMEHFLSAIWVRDEQLPWITSLLLHQIQLQPT